MANIQEIAIKLVSSNQKEINELREMLEKEYGIKPKQTSHAKYNFKYAKRKTFFG